MDAPRQPDDETELPELSFAGTNSFLKAEELEPTDLPEDTDVGVIGVPFDGGVSRRPGARFGPAALRRASCWYAYLGSYKGGLHNVDTGRTVNFNDLSVYDCGDAPTVPTNIHRTRRQVADFVQIVAEQTFPVVLGGDHYITYPAFLGVTGSADQPFGVIQLDAHSDTVESSELHGEHFHGSPMARINESEYGGYQNHAMVGIRSYESPEFDDLRSAGGLQVSTAEDVREQGIEASVESAIDHATDGVDKVYVTIDIDVVDPAFAAGTGTPEPGGITSSGLLRAADQLGQCEAVAALDLMEVAPKIDPTESTERLGAKAIVRFLESKFL